MSRSLGIHNSSDGEFIPLPKRTPKGICTSYSQAYIMEFWSEFQELSDRLDVAPIHEFFCDPELLDEFEALEEELIEAQEDGDDEAVEKIRTLLPSVLPAFQPNQVRETFSAFRSFIEDHQNEIRSWKGSENYEDIVPLLLENLQGFEIVLEAAHQADLGVILRGY